MGRTPCCEKNGLKKGPWTPEEDQKLVDYIHKHGYGNWRTLPKNAGLQRCGKSCRLRWTNYLRPDIKRGRFSFEEEETIIHLHSILGNKWSAIASRLPGRTDNEIKNYWNTHIRKRLLRMGIDPVTHNPRLDLLDLSSLYGSISHMQHPLHHLNPELLKLATSLFSQNSLLNNNNLNRQQNQFISDDDVSLPYPQAQFLEYSNNNNVVDSSSYPSNLHHDELISSSSSDYWQANNNVGIASTSSPYYYVNDQLPPSYYYSNNNYYSHHANLVDPPMSETSTFHSNNNSSNFVSVSTPSSSPKPLNSSYVNGNNSSTEDERESYVSTNNTVFRFEIPDMLLDVNAFV
ncbi:hypothetical protein PIB30_058548 [Stylosanthes scabra]|uniref:Uncharacterized protein n=1 Tax=Stylosanthes scabra TaxID=79078 RepID=A0ABU6UNJ9_9FABA|nr:hypothetical protein [Stylosanthes scabra]